MERTINKANGSDQEQPGAARGLVRNAVPSPNGVELIWNTREGVFVGSAILRGISPQALKAMVEDLVPFIEEETRKAMFAAAPSAANAPGGNRQ